MILGRRGREVLEPLSGEPCRWVALEEGKRAKKPLGLAER